MAELLDENVEICEKLIWKILNSYQHWIRVLMFLIFTSMALVSVINSGHCINLIITHCCF